MLEGTEGRLLNCVIHCTQSGWEMEPDQRHVDLIIKYLDLDGANEVITPGEKDPKGKAVENEEELDPAETTRYRALVARANYLAADRPDIMYAVKELCRGGSENTGIRDYDIKTSFTRAVHSRHPDLAHVSGWVNDNAAFAEATGLSRDACKEYDDCKHLFRRLLRACSACRSDSQWIERTVGPEPERIDPPTPPLRSGRLERTHDYVRPNSGGRIYMRE